MKSQAEMAVALLDVMEFCHNELVFGAPTERLEREFTRMRDRCYELLGEPTVADAARIRARVVSGEG